MILIRLPFIFHRMNTISKERGGDADEEKNWIWKEEKVLDFEEKKAKEIEKSRNKITLLYFSQNEYYIPGEGGAADKEKP